MKNFIKRSVKFKRFFSNQNLEEFTRILGDPKLFSTNINVRNQHGTDIVGNDVKAPDVVIFPNNIKQISEITKICNREKIPIIPFGAGTSLEGHITAPKGGVCFDMINMKKVVSFNQEDMDITVESGMTREEVNQHIKETGLFFPIDPGANASIGGMASTRASGTNAVKYGTMRENILSLKVVLPNGEIIQTSRRSKKSSAGYDLTRLFIGSEGTLGTIAEVTLKLYGLPESILAATCTFPDIESAANVVIQTIQMGIPIARVEILDETAIKAVNLYSKLSLPMQPTLFFEFHGTENSVKEQSEIVEQISKEFGSQQFHWATDPNERKKLWKARHDAYWATTQLKPNCRVLVTDVCVPISNLSKCIGETKKDFDKTGLIYTLVGHSGDGNFHLIVLLSNEEDYKIAHEASDRMIIRALEMDGTCTGEHGIGIGKKKYLIMEQGQENVNLMKQIKTSIDPNHIMNPGKIFDY